MPFKIMDESNSLFIEVNASYEGVLSRCLKKKKPERILHWMTFGVSKSDEIGGIIE